jgi:hypothetical protein
MTVVMLFCHWLGGRMRGVLIGVLAGAFSATVAAGFALWAEILRPEQLLAQPFSWQQIVFLMSWFMGVVAYAIGQLENPKLLQSIVALAFTFAGILTAIVLRELVLRGNLQIEHLGLGLFSLVVLLTLTGVIARLLSNDPSKAFNDLWEWAGPFFLAFIIPFSAFALFADQITPFWNSFISPYVGITLSSVIQGGLTSDVDIRDLFGRVSALLDIVQTPLQIVAIVVVFVVVTSELAEVRKFIGLKPEEVNVSYRLRSHAREAIDKEHELAALYPRKVNIFMDDVPKAWPHESTGDARALVKIFLSSDAGFQNAKQLESLLATGEISLKRSLIFIYPAGSVVDSEDGSKHGSHVIAYGTGWEWKQHLVGSTEFLNALAFGDASGVQSAVDNARTRFLRDNPKQDLLLSTYAVDADTRLSVVMGEIGLREHRRILLTSQTVPQAFAILGLDDVSRYLYSGK